MQSKFRYEQTATSYCLSQSHFSRSTYTVYTQGIHVTQWDRSLLLTNQNYSQISYQKNSADVNYISVYHMVQLCCVCMKLIQQKFKHVMNTAGSWQTDAGVILCLQERRTPKNSCAAVYDTGHRLTCCSQHIMTTS